MPSFLSRKHFSIFFPRRLASNCAYPCCYEGDLRVCIFINVFFNVRAPRRRVCIHTSVYFSGADLTDHTRVFPTTSTCLLQLRLERISNFLTLGLEENNSSSDSSGANVQTKLQILLHLFCDLCLKRAVGRTLGLIFKQVRVNQTALVSAFYL